MAWKDEISRNETLTQPRFPLIPVAKHQMSIFISFFFRFLKQLNFEKPKSLALSFSFSLLEEFCAIVNAYKGKASTVLDVKYFPSHLHISFV